MVAEQVAEERSARILVVEAGDEPIPLGERARWRQRYLDYGENPWPRDHLDRHTADGPLQSRSMSVGGLAMHWGGVTPRFSPEDFRLRSLYGVGDDWPVSYEELDPHYQEAEERLGVAGEQGPPELDPRGKPFPMPPLPLTYNLELLKKWAGSAGFPMWSQPSAKNSVQYAGRSACCRSDTCTPVCPVGARYSPDFTWNALRRRGRATLLTRTLVRRLVPEAGSARISHAVAAGRDRPGEPIEIHARTFVIAAGYAWSPHLLLLSRSARYPNGLANGSGLVGKYMAGHRNVQAFVQLPLTLYPGINEQHSLVTKKGMRPGKLDRYLRHDLRVWESSTGSRPRLRAAPGEVLLADDLLRDWRERAALGTARVRAYYDVLPHRESALTLDPALKDEWGDPMPRLRFRDSDESAALRAYSEEHLRALFAEMARVGNGKVLRAASDDFQDHPAGGCRMGSDPAASVTDSYGRTHDHENLFVVGAPTCVTASCANATLTFCALSLRAASRIGEGYARRARAGD